MIYLAAGAVVFFGIFAYVLFMIFLPEWVGITGKTALKNEQAHLGQTSGIQASTTDASSQPPSETSEKTD